jgi:small ligand-binding sensory domain FIST
MTFRAGHAAAVQWRDAAERCLAAVGDARDATLGFLYLTDTLDGDAAEILEHFRRETGVRHWVGSVGVGVLGTGAEYLDEPAMSVLLADFPEGEFSVFSGKARAPQPGSRTPSGAGAAHFAVVHGDPSTEDMPELIEDMSMKVASGFLVGGLSSARGDTYQIADEVLRGGLSGVVFSDRIDVATRLTQGCSPVGPRHVITEAQRNILVTLDGRPALEVFKEDIGAVAASDLRRASAYLHAALPVAGSDTGDYLVRNVMGVDPQNNLLAIGAYVEPGQSVMFCKRDGDAAREDLERMLASITAEHGRPRGGLYYACLGRGAQMFGRKSREMEILRDALGEVPLAGFACNGEISHDRLYGYTGVLALFY